MAQYSRLVHFAPTLVGPSHSDLALRGLRRMTPATDSRVEIVDGHAQIASAPKNARNAAAANLSRIRTCSTRGSAPGCGRFRRWAGRTTPRLAKVLSDQPADQRLRHSFFLGRADGHAGPASVRRPKTSSEFPFAQLYLHSLVRDAAGQKMSKTRGNVVDPLELIEKYGTDALRFTLAMHGRAGNRHRSERRAHPELPRVRE